MSAAYAYSTVTGRTGAVELTSAGAGRFAFTQLRPARLAS